MKLRRQVMKLARHALQLPKHALQLPKRALQLPKRALKLRSILLRFTNKLTASEHPLARLMLCPLAWGKPVPKPVSAKLEQEGVIASPNGDPAHTKPSLLIGPMNYAGQAHQWAQAVSKHGVFAASLAIESPGGFAFPATASVPAGVYVGSRRWQKSQWRELDSFSHIIIDSFGSLRGRGTAGNIAAEVSKLQARGIQVAYLCHGSDIRSPQAHAKRHTHSPFHQGDWSQLIHSVQRNSATLAKWPGPVFFSTPDLVLDVPQGQWVPVVVDGEKWHTQNPLLQAEIPTVLHVPSNPVIKGSAAVDAVCQKLAAEGLIQYERVIGVPSAQMPELVKGADIVIDQLLLGAYGVAACEAMAAGRLVIGYVDEQVRQFVREQVAAELPMWQSDPRTLETQLRSILENRDQARTMAAQGPQFVQQVHSGEVSAQVILDWLNVHTPFT